MRTRWSRSAGAAALALALAFAGTAQAQGPAAKSVPTPQATKKPAAAAAPPAGNEPDLAFGAYQRGYYLTAFAEASKRANATGDAKSMTLLAELYANGYGVPNDDKKAAQWYQAAADRGDRDAIFALAMFHLGGRGGLSHDRNEMVRLLEAAVKLGHAAAAYDLGLLYLQGQDFPQDFHHAAELFNMAAKAGVPEAQFALATLYREGRGVKKDDVEATRLFAAAALADFTDAQIEYGLALFNGIGIAKNEAAAGLEMRRAALKGSPIAQNRLARMLAFGRGVAPDPLQAAMWHLIARAGGDGDPLLDEFLAKQSPEVQAAAQKSAKPWLDMIARARSLDATRAAEADHSRN